MQHKYWLGAAAGALGMLAMAASAQAAPLASGASDMRAAAASTHRRRKTHTGTAATIASVIGRDGAITGYGYRHYRPYRYYGYGPSFGFYAGPRYYRRGGGNRLIRSWGRPKKPAPSINAAGSCPGS